ncbi:MAG: hypothetical protein JW751_07700 [Polyangiaceae bacterium]|nr:hypothetical protein [Polyangiaceae bacterium]
MIRREAGYLVASMALMVPWVAAAQPAPVPSEAAPAKPSSPATGVAIEPGGDSVDQAADAPPGATWEDGAPTEATKAEPPAESVAASASVVVVTAPANVGPSATEEEAPTMPTLEHLGTYQKHTWVGTGVRTSYVNDPGLDPFAETDALVRLDVGVGRTLFGYRQVSLAAVLDYAVGGRSATARGDATTIMAHQITVAPELRFHVWPRLFVFARPAVGAEYFRASIEESSMNEELLQRAWAVAYDLSAGAAVQLYGKVSSDARIPRLWLVADGGYGWTGRVDLEMEANDDSDAPARSVPLDLGDLTLRGPQFQIAARLSF